MIRPLRRAGIVALSGTLALTGPGIIGADGGMASAQALQRHSSASTVTLTIWNDLFGTPPPGVSNADFWPTKALKMFQAQNPDIRVKVVPTPQDAQSSFAALLSRRKSPATLLTSQVCLPEGKSCKMKTTWFSSISISRRPSRNRCTPAGNSPPKTSRPVVPSTACPMAPATTTLCTTTGRFSKRRASIRPLPDNLAAAHYARQAAEVTRDRTFPIW